MGGQCAGAVGGGDSAGVRVAWLAGVAASAAALLLEAALLVLRPRCRKYDEITLCHLAAARLANSVCEYLMMMTTAKLNYMALHFFVMYTDFALVCFMFVFSKNLYDRVVVVFAGGKWRAAAAAAAVWAAAAPNGALCVLLLHYKPAAFTVYYKVYVSVKFVVLVVNASLFACILRVMCARGGPPARAAAVACALVSLTSLQTLLSDLLTVFCSGFGALNNAFYVINAFQGVHILAIFVMLVRNREAHARARARASLTTSLGVRVVLAANDRGSRKDNPQVKFCEV